MESIFLPYDVPAQAFVCVIVIFLEQSLTEKSGFLWKTWRQIITALILFIAWNAAAAKEKNMHPVIRYKT